jgi:DNA polymerase-3 subunit delta'
VVTANHLTEIIDSGRVSHAQLFLGDTASGSLALALAYAQYLDCEHREHFDSDADGLRADSCGKCPSCLKYQQLSHPDLHLFFPSAATATVTGDGVASSSFQSEFREFLNTKQQRGTIDDWYSFIQIDNKQAAINVRDANEMVRLLSLKSYENAYKVFIIWMPEKMNLPCANTLLKSLEEPSDRTIFLLVAENSDRMLSTILSRTQLVKIPRTEEGLLMPAEMQAEFATLFVTWMRQLFKLNMASLSQWVETVAAMTREQQKQFLRYAQESLRECFLLHLAGKPMHIDFGDDKFNSSFPNMITLRNVELLTDVFNDAVFAIERNAHPKITFMELSFRISRALKNR